jgi:hypothetical protein
MGLTLEGLSQECLSYGLPDKRYLFSYGAHMNGRVLAQMGLSPRAVTVAYLPDYSLGFFGRSHFWSSPTAAAVKSPGRALWGLVYEMGFSEAYRLDSGLDARLDGAGAYFHCPVRVWDAKGGTHAVLMYKKDILGRHLLPSLQYLGLIIEGATERGLPEEYIRQLRSMENSGSGEAAFTAFTALNDKAALLKAEGPDCDLCQA